MSTTTVSRVDATHPVLAQLVDAATRSFTGSVEVSVKDSAARDLKVVVWFEDGAIYAVHADGWTPPDAAYVLHRTGQDFSGLDIPPFQAAYEAERAGRQLMTAADLDLPRRDWAYGLLASALTWSKPSISRNRRASTDSNLITATNWQAVTADVAARVDGLESAWRVVCESLKAAGITPVSATRACGVLAVHIEGSRLFTGGESLDLAAGRRGLSRYAILEELARAILSGAAPSFAQAPPTDEQQLIPEHWEDPERAWGWVGEVPVTVQAQAQAQAQAQPEVVADADVAAHEPLEPLALEAEVEEAFEEPARFVTPDPSEYAEVASEWEPEPAPYAAAEPDPVPDAVAEPAVQGAEGGARELLESWLKSSVSGADATIRMSIVQRMVDSAHAEAAARHQDVSRAQDELSAAVGDARSAASIVSNARAMLGEAHDALEDAEREVARVRAQFSGVMAAAAQAADRAAATAAAARNEDAALQALRAQVASQEAVAASAGRAADQAAREQVSTQAEVDQSAAPALERVTDAAEVIRLTAVTPAQDELDEANRRSAAAAQVAAAAGRGVEINLAAAAQAQAIADSLNFGEPEAA